MVMMMTTMVMMDAYEGDGDDNRDIEDDDGGYNKDGGEEESHQLDRL